MNWFNKNRNNLLKAGIALFVVSVITLNIPEVKAITAAGSTNITVKGPTIPGAGVAGTGVAAGKSWKGIGLGALGAAGNVASWGVVIYGILNVIYTVLLWLITFAYSILNMAINTALDPHWFQIDAVQKGWQLVRDFSNIWFILAILFIAIATILRIESYGVKKWLPGIILMAFLINFSLPITTFIIDISNVIAFQFERALCHEQTITDPRTGAKITTCDISGNIENALNTKAFSAAFVEATKPSPDNTITPENNAPNPGAFIPKAHAVFGVDDAIELYLVVQAIIGGLTLISAAWSGIQAVLGNSSFLGVATKPFVSLIVSDVFLALTAYVLLAIAILFLIRIITLLFIVIVSPFGFLASVMPGAKKFGDEWWDRLFSQAFFAPVSLFFLWISLTLMGNMKDAMSIQGVSYDFTDPTNARLIFYVFSIILLYGSLWAAKKMGAFGADTLISWIGKAQGAITGFVGGLAARNIIAPIGTSLIGAGVPQRIAKLPGGTVLGPSAESFTKWLSTRGKAPENAAAEAALGMSLAATERPNYFAKLNRAGKEAMLRKMKDDERYAFLKDLGDKSPQQRQIAEQILRSGRFTPEEQAKLDLEAWKRLTKDQKNAKFAALGSESKEQVLRSMNDEDKAKFLAGLEKETDPKYAAAALAARGILSSSKLTAKETDDFGKAERKFKMAGAEREADGLVGFMDRAFAGANGDKEAFGYFKAMDDRQRLTLLESWSKDSAKLGRWNTWFGEEISPEDQDKFHKDTLRRASNDTVGAYVNSLEKEVVAPNGTRSMDRSVQERVLAALSSQQQAKLFDTWNGDRNPKNIERFNALDNIAKNKLSAESQQNYYKEVARIVGDKPSDQIAALYNNLPERVGIEIARNRKVDLNIELIETLDAKGEKAALEKIFKHIKEAGQTGEYAKKINMIQKIQYIDGDNPGSPNFERKIVEEIKSTPPKEFSQKVTTEVIENETVQKAIIQNSNIEQLAALITIPARLEKVREMIKTPIQQELNTGDRQAILDSITEKFERQNHNKDLADQLKVLWGNQLNGAQKALKKRIFG